MGAVGVLVKGGDGNVRGNGEQGIEEGCVDMRLEKKIRKQGILLLSIDFDTGRTVGDIQSHRDLMVWQKSMDLVELVYQLTENFPKAELYRLTSQLARAVVSVPANIAEGNARASRKEYAHFLSIAKGSLMETETYLLLAVRLNYLSQEQVTLGLDLITIISKMLTKLRSRLLHP
jgi:four helix bundle protein